MREGLGEVAIQIDHHVGDALLGGRNSARVGSEAEITPDGRLDAVAIEKLALDFGRLERLGADQVDGQQAFVVVTEVKKYSPQNTALKQEI
jgi:hypothetical protein